jgi:ribosomal protein S18 acetylase RimI-like enzyme
MVSERLDARCLSLPSIVEVAHLDIRQIPLERTRALRQRVLRPHMTLEQLARHEGPDAYAVGAFMGDALVAVGFVAPDVSDPGSWRVGGMAAAPDWRGRGAGTRLLHALVGHATERGATRIWCNARLPARSLYERAGFEVISKEFDVPEIGPHLVMERRPPRAPATSARS